MLQAGVSKVYFFCDNVSTFNNKYYLLVLKSVVNMPKKVTTRGECQAPPKNLKIEMHLPYNICYVIIKGIPNGFPCRIA
jgi:hypothetical protein